MYSHYYFNDPVTDFLSKDDEGFEDLLATAAENFPPEHKPEYRGYSPISALSPFSTSSSSESSSIQSTDRPRRYDSDFDPDSDIEQLILDDVPMLPEPPQCLPHLSSDEVIPTVPTKYTHYSRSNDYHTQRSEYLPCHIAAPHPSRKAYRQSVSSLLSAKDPDYEPEGDSEGNGTDDEYIPSPRLMPLKRRRASPFCSNSSKRRASASREPQLLPTPSTSVCRPSKKARRPPAARNLQLSWEKVKELADRAPALNFRCPVDDYVQRNHRMPDFRRHIWTHAESDHQCIGVPLVDAAQYKIDPETCDQFIYHEELRVGGCMRTFSRRDALKRHLKNSNLTCVEERKCEDED
ncbi:hypothetical protein H0H81_005687 [Sphagnurus paluster]|uniref:C2H2-type domain-containing protein n=1 Tax=Sphagnurus paluster TaxID=117069 RepID=A0A9P7K6T2_9AGAR|nr:hypothetical protein H0H81_005687 [Sphagnurus paluster]